MMDLAGFDLAKNVFIIAEAGNNHEGDIAVALEMVRQAAANGADAVKFQTIIPEQLVSPDQEARLTQLRRFQLSAADYARLAEEAHQHGILFFSSVFSLDGVELLEPLVKLYKIASGDITFMPLIERVAMTGKPVIISTGGSTLTEAQMAVDCVRGTWKRHGIPENTIAILHCVSAYPTPPDEANLSAITELMLLDCVVGYSDHTKGPAAAQLAVALGARVIEKHFTLSHTFSEFRDHALSLEPQELKDFVAQVRQTQAMLGSGLKGMQPSEAGNIPGIRRSICAARDLPAGTVLTKDDLTWLRGPGVFQPGVEMLLVGKTLLRARRHGEAFAADDLQP